MVKIIKRPQKRLFGMTAFQITVLFLMALLAIGVMGFVALLIFGNTTPASLISNLGISNPTKAIIGKWEFYEEPTLTPTSGTTQTPIIMTGILGTPYPVNPAQTISIRIGCNFGYPPNIEFFSDGTYAGSAVSVWSDIFVWQGGQYKILDDGRIKMQTKNGFAVYNFLINGDKLTFTDDAKCEFSYLHVPTASSITENTATMTNTASITDTVVVSPTPTWTFTPTIQTSPTRTKASTWTSLPQTITPVITPTATIIPLPPTWTPTQTIQPSPTRTRAPTWTSLP